MTEVTSWLLGVFWLRHTYWAISVISAGPTHNSTVYCFVARNTHWEFSMYVYIVSDCSFRYISLNVGSRRYNFIFRVHKLLIFIIIYAGDLSQIRNWFETEQYYWGPLRYIIAGIAVSLRQISGYSLTHLMQGGGYSLTHLKFGWRLFVCSVFSGEG